ncbi:RusA family crossover junction endodeoxyribonuclease [Edwardsiella piscicida]|uniref:RusA family crossover junction endodeoxyribonuclease n=1 Tax=Edwardsiella piscicida TaxID=1263550 RepID=UPI0009324F95|nr:RusA family crossover junction endodeoxyribonuclease [Edwardsiella piscicida]EKS7794123.1 RusA family crossover junction endodeoxyribonuclease [Edwardsiella piscicida]EKS7812995.1 RusA family crossover junction endodeoxyribonuclease [Edwardsiella piscicida]ELM3730584.1 RusA family crossover junction endodeoxyribonuclease [Edwardsiella piscicida]ELV7538021.1 RusA family crossover junction endodeoxyribonuclease [Edwardsiella piscicida]UCQ20192.1 RusA family crossover junction endodeoxyribonuc
MRLYLPFPPSVNTYWRAPSRGPLAGRHLVSARGRAFHIECRARVLEQLRRYPVPMAGDLSVHVVLYPPTRASRDLDNFFKAPLDSMTKIGIWHDDSQIKRLTAEFGEVVKGGCVEITVQQILSLPKKLSSK